jgi:Thioredoxin like C-terminal domain
MTIAAAHLGMFRAVEGNQRAPRELAAIGHATEWLNSPRLTAENLLGKVVVVDFCTYTCINWLRTLSYVRAWSQRYTQGAVVIGVHTPEFPFEHDIANVRRAVRQMRIEYPIVIDNDYSIWRAFSNQYWPALYFVDVRGRVRQHQFGEGEYDTSERAIQRLLKEAGVTGVGDRVVSVDGSGFEAAADWTNLRSPETYVGYERAERFASPDAARPDQRRTYRAPSRLALNQWSLAGDWTVRKQAMVLNTTPGQILYRFHASDVHLVMGPSRPRNAVRFRVSIDGQPPGAAHGLDIDESGNGTLSEQRLYQLVRQPKPIVDRTFTIDFLEPGVEVFSFTFG